jgi:hypothetical protein
VGAGAPLAADGSVADRSTAQASRPSLLPADRATSWKPGLMASGGIPARSKICASLEPLGGQRDDTAQIQAAISACPAGQVVQLSAGTFLVNGGKFVLINRGITLRGAGPERTTIAKLDGAKPYSEAVGPKPSPLIVVGPSLYAPTPEGSGTGMSADLARDAVKGEHRVQVASSDGFAPGQIVLLDEASGAAWQTDRQGRGRVWASPDWRVVWKKHDPPIRYVDDFEASTYPHTPGTAGSWFSRRDRPTSEIKEIASVDGNTVTFTTPIHITYRKSQSAQLTRYLQPHVRNAGVEDLKLAGGDAGNLRFHWAAASWARNIDSTVWHDEGIAIDKSFRVELRDFYVHDAAWAQPGGGGYAISLSSGSSEVLVENGIVVRANKLMVARSAGAGSVFGYNYTDMGYINTNGSWIEAGLNASHMAGPHHVLFEGNYGHNAESDDTHGNSIYITFFRNHLRGIRSPFENQAGGTIDDAKQWGNGPKRCVGLMSYSYWMSFLGNVLGSEGEMRGWVYETTYASGTPGIWMLGWSTLKPYPVDAMVAETVLRLGNFDYATNSVRWDAGVAERELPASLYLTAKPAFFDAGRGYTWPWVDALGAKKLHELPAKVRYDAGTPFKQP